MVDVVKSTRSLYFLTYIIGGDFLLKTKKDTE